MNRAERRYLEEKTGQPVPAVPTDENQEEPVPVRITICAECSRRRICYLPARLCERCLFKHEVAREALQALVAEDLKKAP